MSLSHPLAFHASWYYRLYIPPLFKVDADPVALDMSITKENNVTDGHFKYFYLLRNPFSKGVLGG